MFPPQTEAQRHLTAISLVRHVNHYILMNQLDINHSTPSDSFYDIRLKVH